MKLNLRVPVLLTVWLGGMALVWASERQEPVESGAAQSSEATAGEADTTAADPAAASATPDRFVPSEQVRADFDVAFPIDM